MAKKEIEEARKDLAQAGHYVCQALERLIDAENCPEIWNTLRVIKELIAATYFDLLEMPQNRQDDAEM